MLTSDNRRLLTCKVETQNDVCADFLQPSEEKKSLFSLRSVGVRQDLPLLPELESNYRNGQSFFPSLASTARLH